MTLWEKNKLLLKDNRNDNQIQWLIFKMILTLLFCCFSPLDFQYHWLLPSHQTGPPSINCLEYCASTPVNTENHLVNMKKKNFATRCGGKTHTKCYAASSNSLKSPFHQKHDNPTCTAINPFTNDKFWTFPNYEFTDDNFNFGENGRNLYKRVEHTAGKGEIAHYKQFLLFPQCFQMTCTADM